MSEQLDEEKLQALSRWSASLQGDARAEVAAAGRAIAMLVEEVDRLQRLLRLTRAVEALGSPEPEAVHLPETSSPPEAEPEPEPEPERTLTPEQRSFRERLASRNVFPMRSKSADAERS
ncbi:MAG TPA: hypothetical protein VF091_06240 [Gaiellaceae bacterium]